MGWFRLALLPVLMIASGCGVDNPGDRKPLQVAAASDLQKILPELVEAYQAESGFKVVLTFGASGQLAEQIKEGAPFDLFLAANRKYVDDLAALGLVRPESVASYAVGALVLAVHQDAPELNSLDDLRRDDIKKIAIANPEFAPYGVAARQVLRASGLWDSVQAKLVLGETVRQTLQYVQTGNVEAGLVGKATASVPGIRIVEIDPKLYDPIVQNLGITRASENPFAAKRFHTFLLSEKARSVFSSHGFGLPPKASP